MKIAQRTAANVASIPAPVGGWNVRDSLANMSPTDAVTMTNFFPTVSSVNLRGGFSKWSTGITGQVDTVMAYETGSVSKLFGIAGGSIYNCTTKGAVGAAEKTGLSISMSQRLGVVFSMLAMAWMTHCFITAQHGQVLTDQAHQ